MIGIVVLLVCVLYRKVNPFLAAGLIALLFVGLWFSYSQSSMAALFVVTLALAAVAGGRSLKLVAALTAVVVLVGAAGILATSARDHSARRFTSDRSRRVELTWKVFRSHPVVGVGLGSQPVASQARSKQGGSPTRFVSHTTPLTVAAELGVIGLAAYLALLGGSAVLIEQVRRRAPPLGLGLGAVLLALFVALARLQRVLRGSRHVARGRGRGLVHAVAGRRRSHTRRVNHRLRPVVAAGDARRAGRDHDPGARRRSVAVHAGRGAPARPPRPARPRRRPRVGPRHPPLDGASSRDCSSRSPPRQRGASAPGRAGSRSRSRSSSAGCCSCPRCSSRSASATRPSPGTSRTTRRIRSRSPATSSGTDTPRTATTTAARGSSASTRPRSDRGGGVRPRGETPLRLLPGHGADRRRVARAPAALGRLQDLRAPRDTGALTRGARLPRSPLRAFGRRLGPGREPDPAQRRLVRDRGCACTARARPRLRPPGARSTGLGRREPRRCARR